VGPSVGLDVEKRKFLTRDSNSDPSVVQPIASRYTDCANPAPTYNLEKIVFLVALTARGLNFVEFNSGGLHERHAVKTLKFLLHTE
jgi:hypothetical protein